MFEDFILIKKDEERDDYIIRICNAKKKFNLEWCELARVINDKLGENNTGESIRKFYERQTKLKGLKKYTEPLTGNETSQEMLELAKIKAKISDERVQMNAYVRQIAREETLKDIAVEVANKMSNKKMLPKYDKKNISTYQKREAILELSDVHYGAVVSNYWNEYNPEATKKYFGILKSHIIEKCDANGVKVLHVVNLGDLINGLIHLRIRLESRIDVVTQTIEISEILAEFLNDLTQYYEVHFYSCLDNHSRLDPNKKDSLDLESMARIIPWYLKERLGDTVIFHENKYDPEITTFTCNGFNILGVHGDKDKLNTIVEKMSVMTHEHYDLILTAHLHHFSCDEQNETLVVSNGSMLGTDTFAKNYRLTSKPSQNLIIVDRKNVAECIYRIILS